jgi:hypothetical protein
MSNAESAPSNNLEGLEDPGHPKLFFLTNCGRSGEDAALFALANDCLKKREINEVSWVDALR